MLPEGLDKFCKYLNINIMDLYSERRHATFIQKPGYF